MLVLRFCQAAFAIAAVLACIAALRSVLMRRRTLSFNLTLAGVFSLGYFLCIPDVTPQFVTFPVLVIAIGALLMPSENLRSRRELVEDMDVGDSTAARHLKR